MFRYPSIVLLGILLGAPCTVIGLPAQDVASAQEYAGRGKQLIRKGELAAAEAELRKAIELAPANAEYPGLLGVVLGMRHRLDESDVYLEKALRIDATDSVTRRNLAWNQFELGQLVAAKHNLARVLRDKPQDAAAILLMGMIEEELKHYANAVSLLESVLQEVQRRAESVAALARAYYYTGRQQKSREILKNLPQDAAEPEGLFLAAQIAAEINDLDIAEALFQSMRTSYPDKAKLGYALARVQYKAGKFSECLETLQRTIEAGHESSDMYNLLGWCLFKRDDLRGAVAALDKAIELDPAEESNYVDVGMMLLENHRFEGATAAAQKALEIAPDCSGASRLKAQLEFKLRRVNNAEALYARAVELNPMDADAAAGLATAQLDMGKMAAAEETLKTAIKRLPRAALLYQAYGTMLLWGANLNRDIEARAVQLLHKAETLDPALAEAHYELGKLALRNGNTREAVRELETAVKLAPKSSKNHYGLAQAYRKMARDSDAEREVQLFQAVKQKESSAYPAAEAASSSSGTARKKNQK